MTTVRTTVGQGEVQHPGARDHRVTGDLVQVVQEDQEVHMVDPVDQEVLTVDPEVLTVDPEVLTVDQGVLTADLEVQVVLMEDRVVQEDLVDLEVPVTGMAPLSSAARRLVWAGTRGSRTSTIRDSSECSSQLQQ
jgi:hypothetical protein